MLSNFLTDILFITDEVNCEFDNDTSELEEEENGKDAYSSEDHISYDELRSHHHHKKIKEVPKYYHVPVYEKVKLKIPHPVPVPVPTYLKVPIPQPYAVHVKVEQPIEVPYYKVSPKMKYEYACFYVI